MTETVRATRESERAGRWGYLIHSPTAREEVAVVMAMKGDVQHSGVLVEGLLGAVAMVNILGGRGGSIRRNGPGSDPKVKIQLAPNPHPMVNSGGEACP